MISEIVNDDGSMKRSQQLRDFADEHGLVMISIEDLIHYRRRHENHVERVAETRLPTAHGDFTAYGYRITIDGSEHIALVYGDIGDGLDVLTRVHSECLTGDVFGSRRCDCGPQLEEALQTVVAEGRGVVGTCAATRAADRPGREAAGLPAPGRRPRQPTPTSTWACRRTPVTTAPPRRSCATSG